MKKPTILWLIGEPCSGKSTYAKMLAINAKNTAIINRDSLREMLFPYYVMDLYLEPAIAMALDTITAKCIELGYDLIMDNTNCNLKYLKGDVYKYRKYNNKFLVFSITAEDFEIRNNKRYGATGKFIPKDVFDRMAANKLETLAWLTANYPNNINYYNN